MKNDLLKIVQHYEISNQQRKFVEECYELIEAILDTEAYKLFEEGESVEYNEKGCKDHIAEEISDVMVMLKQFQYYYGISDEQIEDVMKFKIKRQLERIESEGKED